MISVNDQGKRSKQDAWIERILGFRFRPEIDRILVWPVNIGCHR